MFVVAGRVISVSSSSATRIFTASSGNPFSLCVSRFQVRAMADSASPPFKKIQIQRDDTTFDAYVVGKEDAPGIVVLQEWWGVDFEIKNHAVKISQLGPGFKALIPDLYRGKVGLDVAEAQHLMDGLDWQGAVKDIQASVNWLKTNETKKTFCDGTLVSMRIQDTGDMFTGTRSSSHLVLLDEWSTWLHTSLSTSD
ncbi:protein usf [Salix suchowensis]|nr:protein usf [Salix suchowensis]